MNTKNCPCGREKRYIDCCKLSHEDLASVKTAEDLMRSRYTATETTVTKEEVAIDEAKLAEINAKGKEIYEAKCNECHGFDGTLGKFSATNLKTSTMFFSKKVEIITNGAGMMKAFGDQLSKKEIEAVASYTATFQ